MWLKKRNKVSKWNSSFITSQWFRFYFLPQPCLHFGREECLSQQEDCYTSDSVAVGIDSQGPEQNLKGERKRGMHRRYPTSCALESFRVSQEKCGFESIRALGFLFSPGITCFQVPVKSEYFLWWELEDGSRHSYKWGPEAEGEKIDGSVTQISRSWHVKSCDRLWLVSHVTEFYHYLWTKVKYRIYFLHF